MKKFNEKKKQIKEAAAKPKAKVVKSDQPKSSIVSICQRV